MNEQNKHTENDPTPTPRPSEQSRPAQPPPDPARAHVPLSPIRPEPPDTQAHDSAPPLPPTPPSRAPERSLTPRERLQRAEDALIELREKMARLANEFAAGKLNQAQFDAIYARYSEQRDITERLLARDPASQAWQAVIQPGHTQFLKQHYAAVPLSYAIYALETGTRITLTGTLQMRRPQLEAVLQRLRTVISKRGIPSPAQKALSDGKHVVFVPGELTVAVVIFSREPAAGQVARLKDIHHDFERANHRALLHQDYNTARMVFPHRAIFESGSF